MTPEQLDTGMDFDGPNPSRMYDYLLGGAHNFAVDREQAERLIAAFPDVVGLARANRSYLQRAVRWCAEAGVEQFLDLGSGLPTVATVHGIARKVRPQARVAYVEAEPVSVAHSEEILAGVAGVTVTRADVTDPGAVLCAPGVRSLLDFDRPVALLAVAVLHFLPGDVADLLARYRATLAPGSAMVLAHACADPDEPDAERRMHELAAAFRPITGDVTLRSRAELAAAMADLDLVGPGLVDVTRWPVPQNRPAGPVGDTAPTTGFWGGVGRIR